MVGEQPVWECSCFGFPGEGEVLQRFGQLWRHLASCCALLWHCEGLHHVHPPHFDSCLRLLVRRALILFHPRMLLRMPISLQPRLLSLLIGRGSSMRQVPTLLSLVFNFFREHFPRDRALIAIFVHFKVLVSRSCCNCDFGKNCSASNFMC